jgi:DNA-binding transcriptional ArsR family regulator
VSLDPAPGSIAAVFVALADPSRRQVLGVLAARGTATATAVAEELAITRQAVAKHLGTLSDAGLVDAERAGREVRYRLRPAPLRLAARWLDSAAGAWDDRLAAVKDAVEQGQGRKPP